MHNLTEFTEVAAVKPIAPYTGGKRQLSRTLCEMIVERLAQLKGRFILSLNDVPQIRELFSGFEFREVGLTYSIPGKGTEAKELIITGGK